MPRREAVGRSTDPSTALVFEIEPFVRDTSNNARLMALDYIVLDIDTNSTNVTPRLVLEQGNVDLTVVNTSARRQVEIQVDRFGPVHELRLLADFTTDIQVFGVETFFRPLDLLVQITGEEGTVQVTGRADAPQTELAFELPLVSETLAQYNSLLIVDRVVVEIDTNSSNITPTLITAGGTISLTAVNTAARDVVEIEVDRIAQLQEFKLVGDFTANVKLFRVALYIRPIFAAVNFPGGERLEITGKSIDPSAEIIFEVPPKNPILAQFGRLLIVDRLVTDLKTTSMNTITPVIINSGSNISLTGITDTSRTVNNEEVDRLINLRQFKLTGDFTADVNVYGIELFVRPLRMGINVNG